MGPFSWIATRSTSRTLQLNFNKDALGQAKPPRDDYVACGDAPKKRRSRVAIRRPTPPGGRGAQASRSGSRPHPTRDRDRRAIGRWRDETHPAFCARQCPGIVPGGVRRPAVPGRRARSDDGRDAGTPRTPGLVPRPGRLLRSHWIESVRACRPLRRHGQVRPRARIASPFAMTARATVPFAGRPSARNCVTPPWALRASGVLVGVA
jgi:hypothetical protein